MPIKTLYLSKRNIYGIADLQSNKFCPWTFLVLMDTIAPPMAAFSWIKREKKKLLGLFCNLLLGGDWERKIETLLDAEENGESLFWVCTWGKKKKEEEYIYWKKASKRVKERERKENIQRIKKLDERKREFRGDSQCQAKQYKFRKLDFCLFRKWGERKRGMGKNRNCRKIVNL